jgi:hypothetical protein
MTSPKKIVIFLKFTGFSCIESPEVTKLKVSKVAVCCLSWGMGAKNGLSFHKLWKLPPNKKKIQKKFKKI